MKRVNLINKKSPKSKVEVLNFLLENRGITTKKDREEFLSPQIESLNLTSVGIDNKSIERTLKRIKAAIKRNEKIIIYGDYDVDGITGTAILWETIYREYKNILPYIPHRIEEGYGLSVKGIDNVLENNPDVGLIITVDNGIVADDPVDYANKKGIDVIITDHHISASKLPNAYSIIHSTKLCGAGVSYFLSLAFENAKPDKKDPRLELVALATIADLVPLTNANRILVKFGIELLRKTNRHGLIAIFDEAKIKKAEIDTYHIGHIIAPRLNAAGRIGHAMDSLRLLCTNDKTRARKLASEIGATNKERQMLTTETALHADTISKQVRVSDKFIFIHDESYNPGIIGLVAARLVEAHYRPAIVISVGEKVSKGSARSIKGFNMIEFIREYRHMLIDAGGHPMAAGFTIETDKIKEFKKALLKSSANIISDEMLDKNIDIDMEIEPPLLNLELYDEIQKLAPFGMGNPEPLFITRNLEIAALKVFGKANEHLKISLKQYSKIDGLFFRGAKKNIIIGSVADVIYTVFTDNWNDNLKLQLKIKDFHFD